MTKIFVTGATGTVGNDTVDELLSHGYEVLGLARSDSSAKKLEAKGVKVIRGDLQNLEALKKGAKEADGVINLAFIHNFADMPTSLRIDKEASQAILDELKGTNKTFIGIVATTTLAKSDTTPVSEDAPYSTAPGLSARAANERFVLSYADKGVKVISVRFPPTVHGVGDTHQFIPGIIAAEKQKGVSVYIGDGTNVWSAVSIKDTAKLLRLAFEKGKNGAKYNSVAESGVPFKDIAKAIGKKYNWPVKSVTEDEAPQYLGAMAGLINPVSGYVSSKKTQSELGWKPSEPGLLDDIATYY